MVTNCVSGYPVSEKDIRVTDNEKTQQTDSDIKAFFSSTYEHDLNLMAVTRDRIVTATGTNGECCTLVENIQKGFPKLYQKLPLVI